MNSIPRTVSRLRIPLMCLKGTLILLCESVNAQTYMVWGQVDANNLSLANVRIVAAHSQAQTVTDETGKFNLTVLDQDTLTFIHPNFPVRGYKLPRLEGPINFRFDVATNQGTWTLHQDEQRATTDLSISKGTSDPKIPSFPWPVPPSSADVVLDPRFFTNVHTLAQADMRLKDALEKSGYPSPHYYQIPNGFAMVGPLEQTEQDGTPKPPPARWSAQIHSPFSQFKLSNYLQLLYKAATGHFRVIVFLVTDIPAEKSQSSVTDSMAKAWYNSGVSFLPAVISRQAFTSDYRITALIYEFEKPENSKVRFVNPSSLIGRDHLRKSKVTDYLAR